VWSRRRARVERAQVSRFKAGREAFPPRDFAIEKVTDHPAHALAAADDARDRLCVVVVEALRRSSVPGEVVPRLAAMEWELHVGEELRVVEVPQDVRRFQQPAERAERGSRGGPGSPPQRRSSIGVSAMCCALCRPLERNSTSATRGPGQECFARLTDSPRERVLLGHEVAPHSACRGDPRSRTIYYAPSDGNELSKRPRRAQSFSGS